MLFLCAGYVIGADIYGRGIWKDSASLFFQLLKLVEGSIPFMVGHELALSIVISVGRLVEPFDESLHDFELIFLHNYL